jgi:pyruvate formate lyase activating enzyme
MKIILNLDEEFVSWRTIFIKMIFNIQRYSTHDGQGIRTMIFYKGCPLRCMWCSNPESQSFEYSLLYNRSLCKSFGECLKTGNKAVRSGDNGIEIDYTSLSNAEKFRNVCPARAITISGEEKSTEEILSEIEKDLPFYRRSDGGVTLSGGEPLSQGSDLIQLLQELKKREINVSIETSLHVQWDMIERCIDFTGTFLTDLKHTNPEKFRKYTDGDVSLVMDNLVKLSALHDNIIVRVPVVPDFNHTMAEMKGIIDFTVSLRKIREIHFLPYHTLGNGKYKAMGMHYSLNETIKVEEQELLDYIKYAESAGLKAKIGG